MKKLIRLILVVASCLSLLSFANATPSLNYGSAFDLQASSSGCGNEIAAGVGGVVQVPVVSGAWLTNCPNPHVAWDNSDGLNDGLEGYAAIAVFDASGNKISYNYTGSALTMPLSSILPANANGTYYVFLADGYDYNPGGSFSTVSGIEAGLMSWYGTIIPYGLLQVSVGVPPPQTAPNVGYANATGFNMQTIDSYSIGQDLTLRASYVSNGSLYANTVWLWQANVSRPAGCGAGFQVFNSSRVWITNYTENCAHYNSSGSGYWQDYLTTTPNTLTVSQLVQSSSFGNSAGGSIFFWASLEAGAYQMCPPSEWWGCGTIGTSIQFGFASSVSYSYASVGWGNGSAVDAYITDGTSTAPVGPYSANPRRAVVLEAFNALRPSADGGCDKYINYQGYADCASSWNYLNDQTYPGSQAMIQLVPVFGTDASIWAILSDGNYYDAEYDTGISPSFYSDLVDYGYSVAGGSNGLVGRGGQCVFFANNILYRSQSDQSTLNFATMMNIPTNSNPNPDPKLNPDPNLQDVQMGDVLFLYGGSGAFSVNHVAIVVNLYPGPDGIEAVDVIDSNYVPDDMPISSGREVITKHSFCLVDNGNCPFYPNVQTIQGQGQRRYQIWTGTQYYHTLYVPNQ